VVAAGGQRERKAGEYKSVDDGSRKGERQWMVECVDAIHEVVSFHG
jgi:hypothetical protein